MARRLLLLSVCVLFLATPAAGDVVSRKQAVDTKLERLHARIAAADAREGALSREIASVSSRIRQLEAQVGVIAARLEPLEEDLALHQRRLDRLNALWELETKQLIFLQGQYRAAVERLETRVIEIYESPEPTTIDVVIASDSFQDLLDELDYLQDIAEQDRLIAKQVGAAKHEMHRQRERTRVVRRKVADETEVIAVRARHVEAVRDRLLASKHELTGARARKRTALVATRESEQEMRSEAEALSAVSAQLAARIQAAQSASPSSSAPADSTPSSSGLIWPVAGPVTSPFGWRWGRMHEGIDIGAGYGTPIHAAASGSVIYCGWMSGYGNLVVIDHGGGLATAYAHQSSIAVGCGQQVSQGQVIGYVGCTGHCFGPHLHFEVRVNGQPVDPLGYL